MQTFSYEEGVEEFIRAYRSCRRGLLHTASIRNILQDLVGKARGALVTLNSPSYQVQNTFIRETVQEMKATVDSLQQPAENYTQAQGDNECNTLRREFGFLRNAYSDERMKFVVARPQNYGIEERSWLRERLAENYVGLVLTTGPKDLEDLHFDGFYIVIYAALLGRVDHEDMDPSATILVGSISGMTPEEDDDVIHPHVSGNRLCIGNGYDAAEAALRDLRLSDLASVFEAVLNTYNEEGAYVRLCYWSGLRYCGLCGEALSRHDNSVQVSVDGRLLHAHEACAGGLTVINTPAYREPVRNCEACGCDLAGSPTFQRQFSPTSRLTVCAACNTRAELLAEMGDFLCPVCGRNCGDPSSGEVPLTSVGIHQLVCDACVRVSLTGAYVGNERIRTATGEPVIVPVSVVPLTPLLPQVVTCPTCSSMVSEPHLHQSLLGTFPRTCSICDHENYGMLGARDIQTANYQLFALFSMAVDNFSQQFLTPANFTGVPLEEANRLLLSLCRKIREGAVFPKDDTALICDKTLFWTVDGVQLVFPLQGQIHDQEVIRSWKDHAQRGHSFYIGKLHAAGIQYVAVQQQQPTAVWTDPDAGDDDDEEVEDRDFDDNDNEDDLW